jgi:hypothetical protein
VVVVVSGNSGIGGTESSKSSIIGSIGAGPVACGVDDFGAIVVVAKTGVMASAFSISLHNWLTDNGSVILSTAVPRIRKWSLFLFKGLTQEIVILSPLFDADVVDGMLTRTSTRSSGSSSSG